MSWVTLCVFAPVSALRNAAMRLHSHSRLAVCWSEGQGHHWHNRGPLDSQNVGHHGQGAVQTLYIGSAAFDFGGLDVRSGYFRSGPLFGLKCTSKPRCLAKIDRDKYASAHDFVTCHCSN